MLTTTEAAKLLYTIRIAYPQAYSRATNEDLTAAAQLWARMLEDYTYQQASAGLMAYMASDSRGFPPSPGQVIDQIVKRQQSGQMTGAEAWAMVRRALRNSSYHAEEEFDRLPPEIQQAIGGASALRDMSRIDSDEVATVCQSHFLRAYSAIMARREEEAKLPERVRLLLENTVVGLYGHAGEEKR